MNILTICEGGNVRSVGLARLLKNNPRRHNVVAIGAGWALDVNNGRQPGFMLSDWAQMIVIMSEHFLSGVPIMPHNAHKVKICEVGRDVYGNPSHPDLIAKCEAWISKEGL